MSKSQNNTTIAELKEKCKELGCSTSGTKTELIQRLREVDPSEAWAQKNVTNTAPRVVCEEVRFPDAEDVGRFLNDNCEEEVRRNDKHLLEEELKLVRRELELVRSLRGAVLVQSDDNWLKRKNKVTGEMGEYENWERQLRMLRATYSLNDNQVRMLISMRLKEKALEWFYSKSDYVTIPIEELLADLRSTFCHRQNRIVLRKIFEERVWRKDESFREYVHNKVILGNKVPIHEDEIVDYIIEGIPDANLKNQAKINRLRTKADILEAFEGVTLQEKNRIPGDTRFVRRPYNMKNWNTGGWKSTKQTRSCFICGSFDHMADSCPKKKEGPTCYNCKERGHIASNCPKKYPVVKESLNTFRIQEKKCVIDVRVNNCCIKALIDTGSDICLMRFDQYIELGSPRLMDRELKFSGVGGGTNTTIGEYYARLTIDNNLYVVLMRVVPNTVMSQKLILGIDFLSTVDVAIKDGNAIITPKAGNDLDRSEIFKIDLIEKSLEIEVDHVNDVKCQQEIKNLVADYNPRKTKDIGVKMSIVVKDNEPVYQRARRLSQSQKDIVNQQIQEWMEEGIVQPSLSEYASPIVLVEKRDGSFRLCVDYRKLNQKIVKDRYPLPLIEDQLDQLQGANYFSTLDLKNGFFHVSIEEESRKYTAFIVPDGHYEFLKVPFGLYTASQAGLQINWKKCSFLQSRVEFLGHIIENGRIRPSERKTEAVKNFPTPTNIRQVQSFLGLSGYFRKFIPHYSLIARPLTDLLKLDAKFTFGEEQENAFIQLKEILVEKPVLSLYRVGAETQLHTDASMHGYGAILLQKSEKDNAWHPIFYASGKTTPAEKKYTSYELEVLAIIKALKKFRVYLLGISFKIITDCRAFALTMGKKDLCVRIARWVFFLQDFNYVIEHRPGKNMLHVDALSRQPLPSCMIIEESKNGLMNRLRQAQRSDSDVQKIIDLTKDGKINGYEMRGDLLFKEVDDDFKLVVPKQMCLQIIRQAHEVGHFSFTWLYSTKSTSSSEVVMRLRKQAAIFGNPRRIISDRGTAFTSAEFKNYCTEERIVHSLITTGVPRANGQVERVNRTLIPLLTKLSDTSKEEWYKYLDTAQQFLNITLHRSIEDLQIKEMIESELISMFEDERNELRERAKESISKVQRENRKTFNKKRVEARVYRDGDLVAIKRMQQGPGLKLANKFLGPLR
ncbi:uncharacterized protein LOC122521973 [Polistes fuscatus]|uniref:uncharacterized protein LOC122521973 n=1 Tax=Polistes fuscatus TaxID=30207 RepID=UPI001CA85E25|nr:uncharacterized protein LOC122521973 [Polistes fuscatus]